MLKDISTTQDSIVPPVSEKLFTVYCNGVVHSMFSGTRAKASKYVRTLFNKNPAADWEFE